MIKLNNDRDIKQEFYHSSVWKKCRAGYISSVHGICERCGKPGNIVHHKNKITVENINDPEITLNHNNLECVCITCHNIDEQNEHGRHTDRIKYTEYTFDLMGNVIPR